MELPGSRELQRLVVAQVGIAGAVIAGHPSRLDPSNVPGRICIEGQIVGKLTVLERPCPKDEVAPAVFWLELNAAESPGVEAHESGIGLAR